jgi:hypothetical protein
MVRILSFTLFPIFFSLNCYGQEPSIDTSYINEASFSLIKFSKKQKIATGLYVSSIVASIVESRLLRDPDNTKISDDVPLYIAIAAGLSGWILDRASYSDMEDAGNFLLKSTIINNSNEKYVRPKPIKADSSALNDKASTENHDSSFNDRLIFNTNRLEEIRASTYLSCSNDLISYQICSELLSIMQGTKRILSDFAANDIPEKLALSQLQSYRQDVEALENDITLSAFERKQVTLLKDTIIDLEELLL